MTRKLFVVVGVLSRRLSQRSRVQFVCNLPAAVTIFTALMTVGCAQGAVPLAQSDIDAIRAASQQYLETTRAGNIEAWLNLIAEDAVYMPLNHPVIQGRSAIGEWVRAQPRFASFSITPDEIQGRGDLAFVRGNYSVTPVQGASPVTGNYLEIWQKQSDGNWRVVRDIWNVNTGAGGIDQTTEAVRTAVLAHTDAISKGDMAAILSHHTPDMTLIAADYDPILKLNGPEAKPLLDKFGRAKSKYAVRDLQVQPLGNAAVATFYWDGSIDWGNGTVDRRSRRVTEIWVNQNGVWKEAHHHDSVNSPR